MTNPLVSVVVPNYNYAKYLPERLDSILQQSYQNFEIIILDDVSTDNSREVIESYRSNPHVSKIVYNERNSGSAFKQWRKGIEEAQGELIWIAESDDKCEPVLLEKLVDEFQRDNDLVLAFCLDCFFYDTGESSRFVPKDHVPVTRIAGRKFIAGYMLDGSYVGNASSAVFKREAALAVDKNYMTFKNAGDRLFWIEISELGNVAIVNEHLNYCRRHGSNVTERNYSTGLLQREDRLVLDYVKRKQLAGKYACKVAAARYAYGCIMHKKFSSSEVKEELLNLWQIGLFERLYMKMMGLKAILSKIKHRIIR